MIVLWYLVAVAVLSMVSFGCYGWDKSSAQHDRRRIPESTLHLLALLGGWPGAWAGQRQFRHKTRKTSFLAVFWLSVVMHCGIVGVVAYQEATGGVLTSLLFVRPNETRHDGAISGPLNSTD